MTICNINHRRDSRFDLLPIENDGAEHHYCEGCAYELGYKAGLIQDDVLNVDFSEIPELSTETKNNHNPHAAFALGYADGVAASFNLDEDI